MVFQHVGHEPLGTLDPLLKAAALRIRYVNFAREPDSKPSLDSYDGLIVLGGPMGVYEAHQHPHLITEMRLIEAALKKKIPVLGICLGAQLLAHVLGGDVRKGPAWEFGWCEVEVTEAGRRDKLFAGYQPREKVFQIHQDHFTVPKDAVHLASSKACPGQAFCYNGLAYGLQFHLEVDQAMILRWLHRGENTKLIEQEKTSFAALEAATQENITRSLDLSHETFSRFIDLFQLPERVEILGSDHGRPPRGKR